MRENIPGIKAIVVGTGETSMQIILRLLRANATIINPVKSLDELQAVKNAALPIPQGELVTMLTDVPDYQKAEVILENVESRYGCIDLMAMVFEEELPGGKLTETSYEVWEKMMLEQISAAFIGGRVMLSCMKRRGHGVYITVSRVLVHQSALASVAWNMQVELSRLFAAELRSSGVRYYHVLVGAPEVEAVAQDTASLLLSLYVGHVPNPDTIFHTVPDNHNKI